jgi:hypothetical protein
MPNHDVQIREVPSLKIGNSDIVFDVRLGEDLLGSLCVSRGHVVWRPANNTYGYWMNWTDFGKAAIANGKRRKVNF